MKLLKDKKLLSAAQSEPGSSITQAGQDALFNFQDKLNAVQGADAFLDMLENVRKMVCPETCLKYTKSDVRLAYPLLVDYDPGSLSGDWGGLIIPKFNISDYVKVNNIISIY